MTRTWAAACLGFLAAEAALRASWLAGNRWGYTICDRTHLVHPAAGCGAEQVKNLPFWPGWGELAVCAGLAVLVVFAVQTRTRAATAGVWVAAAVLVTAAFPLHLIFELPAALAGRASDWRDLLARIALLAGGLLFARLGIVLGPQRQAGPASYQPVPTWTRRWAYTAVALPIVGWAIPHTFWLLGVPFGISAHKLEDSHLSVPAGLAITLVPPICGLLTLGLARRWGQEFPRWVPSLHGRPVPRMLAVIPAGVVALALMTYGILSAQVMIRDLADGAMSWSELWDGWAVAMTLLVFFGWGLALAGTTVGYHLATRPPVVAERSPRVQVPV